MVSAAWHLSTYAMALTGLFAMLIFAACIADLIKFRHGFSDSILLMVIVCFWLFGTLAVISVGTSLVLSTLWLLFGWW